MVDTVIPAASRRPRAAAKYAAVAAKLAAAIHAGTYRAGELLPSEPALSRRFEVSRHTVRAALRVLFEQGLIVSQQGLGSVVQAVPVAPRYAQACDSIDDILQYAHDTPREVVGTRRVMADADLAASLECAPGYAWWEINTRRRASADGPMIASSQIWVPDEFADAVAALSASDEPLFVLVERYYGCTFAEIRQAFSLATASTREAADLGLDAGAAVMCVERRFTDARGGLLEVSRTVHPATQFRYETSLRRVVGAAGNAGVRVPA